VGANAVKILMNSFYGVLGTSACRFYNPALANSITGTGKEILLWSNVGSSRQAFGALWRYGQSVHRLRQRRAGCHGARMQLAAALNDELASYIRERWGLRSRLELEFEKTYLRLILPQARHSTRGASKRYAGLLQTGDRQHVEFVGMEVVRRDWTALAKQVQRELYHNGCLPTSRLKSTCGHRQDLARRCARQLLIYRKNLRKAQKPTRPPHHRTWLRPASPHPWPPSRPGANRSST